MIRKNDGSSKNLHSSISRSPVRVKSTFGNAQRFIPKKSFSPDKFYDLPDGLNKRCAGIGFGNKVDLILKEQNEPAQYYIRSSFDEIAQGYRFGQRTQPQEPVKRNFSYIDRANKVIFKQNQQSPQRKSTSKTKKKSPCKNNRSSDKKRLKNVNEETLNQPIKQRKSALRLKYEYSQKYLLGNQRTSYTDFLEKKRSKQKSRSKSPNLCSKSLYLQQEKIKLKDTYKNRLGPGSYNIYSEFGNNLRR